MSRPNTTPTMHMQNVRYVRDQKIAPLLNSLVNHLVVVKPPGDQIEDCLIDYLTELNDGLEKGDPVAKRNRTQMTPTPMNRPKKKEEDAAAAPVEEAAAPAEKSNDNDNTATDESKTENKTEQQEEVAINCALMFIKPHAATEPVERLLRTNLMRKKFRILREGQVTCEQVDKDRIIDRHYATIARYSVEWKAAEVTLSDDAAKKFEDKFGVKWAEAQEKGHVKSAAEAMEANSWDVSELTKQWNEESSVKQKLAPGLYAGKISDSLYVLNGFYPANRAKFTQEGKKILWFVVEWNESDMAWSDFRGNFVGPTNPATAPAESIRGTILKDWESLGLLSAPNVSDNGIHASAGPLEGLAERMVWLGATIDDDVFAKQAIEQGATQDLLKEWVTNPTATIDGATAPVFDLLEDKQTTDVLRAVANIMEQKNAQSEGRAATKIQSLQRGRLARQEAAKKRELKHSPIRVELRVTGATDLIPRDFGDGDPFVIVGIVHSNGKLHVVGKTDVVESTSSPTWDKVFRFSVSDKSVLSHFEFIVQDRDSVGEHDFLGRAELKVRFDKSKSDDVEFVLAAREGNEDDKEVLAATGRADFGKLKVSIDIDLPQADDTCLADLNDDARVENKKSAKRLGKKQEKPSDDKPTEEKPADDKPAEEEKKEETPADDKPADEKKNDEKAAEEAKPSEDKKEMSEDQAATKIQSLQRQRQAKKDVEEKRKLKQSDSEKQDNEAKTQEEEAQSKDNDEKEKEDKKEYTGPFVVKLLLKLIGAENLIARDFGSGDPFATLALCGGPNGDKYVEQGKTAVVSSSDDPTWNAEFTLNQLDANWVHHLEVTVEDEDGVSDNDFIGYARLPINLKEETSGGPKESSVTLVARDGNADDKEVLDDNDRTDFGRLKFSYEVDVLQGPPAELQETERRQAAKSKSDRRKGKKKVEGSEKPATTADDDKKEEDEAAKPKKDLTDDEAATKIQAMQRQRQAKKDAELAREQSNAHQKPVDPESSAVPAPEKPADDEPVAELDEETAATKIQALQRQRQAKKEVEEKRKLKESESEKKDDAPQ